MKSGCVYDAICAFRKVLATSGLIGKEDVEVVRGELGVDTHFKACPYVKTASKWRKRKCTLFLAEYHVRSSYSFWEF
ncbi:MAG: hypothetical protein ACTSWP_09010 [Candidatus Freyarchaeota archaeon]|nr:hypothetical protein [Candidatus Freyrarchaeum guaymaensis]